MGNQRKAWQLRYVLRILHYFFVESDAKELCDSFIFDNLNLSVIWAILIFQAIGLESCESFQEETVSDQEGQYRLRGLQVTTLLKIWVSCFGCKSVREFLVLVIRAKESFVQPKTSNKIATAIENPRLASHTINEESIPWAPENADNQLASGFKFFRCCNFRPMTVYSEATPMLSQTICYPKIALVVWFGMTKTVYFQPGCMYRVRVKIGDSNPHIERASPSFIDIQVRIEIVLFFSFSLIYLFCFVFFFVTVLPFTPRRQYAYSHYCYLYISQGADKENLFSNQEFL